MFDAEQFCKDYNIDYRTQGKNVSQGWIGINDIYTFDNTFHMGINPDGAYVYSWKTGHHFLDKVIQDLLNVTKTKAQQIIKRYDLIQSYEKQIEKKKFSISEEPLKAKHRNFIRGRNYNAQYIEQKYDLRSNDQKLVIPVYYNQEIVSYQERDIDQKFYKSCPKDTAIINYKDILYNLDNCNENYVVVTEGILDCWRLDDNSVSCFGIGYTKKQIALLAKLFTHVIIMFDNEYEAQRKAESMASELDMMGVHSIVEQQILQQADVNDPGDLPQHIADDFMMNMHSLYA